ncbi:MAG: ABC transporter substrate-binding protein [Sporomusaceae bacterium]|nr:ABC transporter substrate-binding protein [Sporomusaceae bacterium]
MSKFFSKKKLFAKQSVFFITALFVVLTFLVSGCGGKADQTGAKTDSKSIILGVENESDKVNPIFADEHDDAISLIFSGLVRYDDKNEPIPDMAESWDISSDKLTYTFHLKKNIKWHDGQPFTADDVKFTIEAALNPKNNSMIRERFEEIKAVQIMDPYTVKIVLKTPFPLLVNVMSTGMLPKHLLEGKDINNNAFNAAPIGTGPFKFVEWKKGQYMKLAANQDFYRQSPKSEQVILKYLPDQNVRALQLETGEIDVALVDPMEVDRMKQKDNLTVHRIVTADYRVLMYNRLNPLWEDARVRQALNYAVDRNALVNGVLLGWGKPAYGPLQLSWANNPDVNPYTFNLEKAKALLTEAGWTPGPDGVLQKDGKRFSFKLTTFVTDPVRVALVNALSTQFKQIGVEAIPDPKEKGSFKIGQTDTFLLGWGSPFDPDDDTYRIFHSSQMEIANYEHYKNTKVDSLLLAARQASDRNERIALYKEFQNELAKDPAFNFLAYLDVALVTKKNLTGIKEKTLGHHGAGYMWNLEEWSKQ